MSTSITKADGSGSMFDRIAERYDLLNRLISMGMDQRWRRALVDGLALSQFDSPRVLDLATGTADIALQIAASHPGAEVVGLDPSDRMLAVGRKKITKLGLDERIELINGDAQEMPFEDDSFAGCCISFGIRNVPDRLRGLREMARVTQPGGRVVVLELGEPTVGLLAPFARFHVHHIVPRLGAWLSGDAEYAYLARSIAAFPTAEEFAELMLQAGLEVCEVRPYSFGAANLYIGRAPD